MGYSGNPRQDQYSQVLNFGKTPGDGGAFFVNFQAHGKSFFMDFRKKLRGS